MRRKDREVSDRDGIIAIIRKCEVCRLGLARDNQPYVIPLNFGFEWEADGLVLYFHCAKVGTKLDIISENPRACFEMDCSHHLIEGTAACDYTMEYESVIGTGRVVLCNAREEKEKALGRLMDRVVPGRAFSFTHGQIDGVTIIKLYADRVTGKCHKHIHA